MEREIVIRVQAVFAIASVEPLRTIENRHFPEARSRFQHASALHRSGMVARSGLRLLRSGRAGCPFPFLEDVLATVNSVRGTLRDPGQLPSSRSWRWPLAEQLDIHGVKVRRVIIPGK